MTTCLVAKRSHNSTSPKYREPQNSRWVTKKKRSAARLIANRSRRKQTTPFGDHLQMIRGCWKLIGGLSLGGGGGGGGGGYNP